MDNDLISRSALEKDLREYADRKHSNGQTELANGILKGISRVKAAPSMELVPCSECKHYDERFNPNSNNYCYIDGGPVHRIMPPDGFCSYGERRNECDTK